MSGHVNCLNIIKIGIVHLWVCAQNADTFTLNETPFIVFNLDFTKSRSINICDNQGETDYY